MSEFNDMGPEDEFFLGLEADLAMSDPFTDAKFEVDAAAARVFHDIYVENVAVVMEAEGIVQAAEWKQKEQTLEGFLLEEARKPLNFQTKKVGRLDLPVNFAAQNALTERLAHESTDPLSASRMKDAPNPGTPEWSESISAILQKYKDQNRRPDSDDASDHRGGQ